MRAFALLVLLGGLARAEAPKLTVEEAVAAALKSYPQLTAARLRSDASTDNARGAIGRMLPLVNLSDEYQFWNGPFNLPFGGMNFLVREQNTNNFTAAFNQPLLGLGRLSEEYLSRKNDAVASRAGLRALEDDIRVQVQVAFLRHFEARARTDLALASAQQLDDQVQVTEAKVKAGVLTTADLLRVRVAAANARQQALVARTQADVTRAQILAAVGIRPDEPRELVEPIALISPANAPAAPRASLDDAIQRRPEIAQARAAMESADHVTRARTWALGPEIDAEGAYLRVDGQKFAPKDSGFFGIRANWAIWEWGTSWYARQAAAHNAQAARADLDGRTRAVEVEVASRQSELVSASSAVQLAEETIASAEEAFRVTEAQVRAGAATTTDLLDSQAALTQARLNRATARYEEAIARLQLARAAGLK
jgi:outer membrane protein